VITTSSSKPIQPAVKLQPRGQRPANAISAQEEQKKLEEQKKQADQRRQEEQKKRQEEQKKRDEDQKRQADLRKQEEDKRIAENKKRQEEPQKQKSQVDEKKRLEEQKKLDEQNRKAEDEHRKKQEVLRKKDAEDEYKRRNEERAREKNNKIIDDLEVKKEKELKRANQCLVDVEDMCLLTEENLENTTKLETDLNDILIQIAQEQNQIEALKATKEQLHQDIEDAKARSSSSHANYYSNVDSDLSTENHPTASSADAVAEKKLTDQKDFRNILKKRNEGGTPAAAPAAEKPSSSVDREQKDFRNVLKKRPN
jgi:hypothetical protein